jgi:RecB family exonuclease
MDGFLNQVAADLYGRYGDGVSSLHVLFPSRRAALFFGEALSEIIDKPLWQPPSITVGEIAGELSGLTVGDRLRLATELFKVYAEFHPTESFDSFYFWGELLLGDFDSIDKYLVDADTLFSNLVDLHALDDRFDYLEPEQRAAIERFWGTFSGNSPEQRDFLKVWRTLGPVYHRFRERLRTLSIAYEGMVYREAAERILSGTAPQIPDRHYVVAGFNALSRSEQTIFEHLRTNFKTDFYWDHDDYFTLAPEQEAGRFMRDNLRRFPPSGELRGGHDNFRRPKTIRSVAAASDVLQCKYAGLALAEIARREGHPPARETALVLCDESLLEPLLWSMPPEVEGINVTMGYPLRLHPSYTFTERLLELQSRRRGGSFYHSDVEGLLNHPYLASGESTSPPRPEFVYIGGARLRTSPLTERIFTPAGEGWKALAEWLIEVLSEVALQPRREEGKPLHGGFFALIVEHIRRLSNSLEGCDVELSIKTYASLLRRSLQGVTVPFEGEPLEGVQVMGILETRALDFDNVIFLSAGDSTMPGSLVGAPSFIPYNLKAAYGLPTPEHHEGVWAYHFFRLISRARNIEAVWSRTTDDRNSGQPSRYILQLDYESPHEVEKASVAVDVNLSPDEAIVVEKAGSVASRLEEFLGSESSEPLRRLSPSLFYSYVECPLKFYFRGVARLRVRDEVSEEVDGALLGNILHHSMHMLYAPLVGVADPRKTIRSLVGSPRVAEAVESATRELYTFEQGAGPEDWGGAIILAQKAVLDYIDRCILPFDAGQGAGFTIEGLEREISGTVSFPSPASQSGRESSVLFRGIADRIDRLESGALKVVDYKTGNPKSNASALLQMGLYTMMLSGGGLQRVEPVLYYVRDMSQPDYAPPPVRQGAEFEEELRANLSELFDTSVPFVQTPDVKKCEWCDFRTVCRR